MATTLVTTASVPLGVGLLTGAGVAVVGHFSTPDLPALAAFVGRAYWLLALLLPVGVWLGVLMTYDDPEHQAAYASRGRALITTLAAAFVGGGLGAGPFFLLAATYLPILLRGADAIAWSVSLREQILWGPWLLVVGLTVLTAIPLAYWATRTRV